MGGAEQITFLNLRQGAVPCLGPASCGPSLGPSWPPLGSSGKPPPDCNEPPKFLHQDSWGGLRVVSASLQGIRNQKMSSLGETTRMAPFKCKRKKDYRLSKTRDKTGCHPRLLARTFCTDGSKQKCNVPAPAPPGIPGPDECCRRRPEATAHHHVGRDPEPSGSCQLGEHQAWLPAGTGSPPFSRTDRAGRGGA